ncbi:MAG: replication initiator protein [Microvirus sp.]|nr:MAG: replication initiator protein [Microvirus sp.]
MATCISQITLKKNGTVMSFPCGKCNYCLQNRRADWTFRLNTESKQSKTAYFLTLTYDEEHQPKKEELDSDTGELFTCHTLDKKDLQDFIKLLRYYNDTAGQFINLGSTKTAMDQMFSELWPPIKYYAVGEYGGQTFRPHYHLIIFNIKPPVLDKLLQIWGKGHVYIGSVEPASVHYVTKYVLNKKHGWDPVEPPFALISQGVGKAYLDTNGHEHKEAQRTFVLGDKFKQRLPRYYKDKIFNIRERESLNERAIRENDILYKKTIDELKQFSEQPENYYDYRQRRAHDLIKDKIEQKSIIKPNTL